MPPSPRELLLRVRAWLLRHRLGLLVAAALVVALRALLPWGLARGVEWQVQEALGRRVEVQDIDLGLLAGRLVVEGLSVGPPLAAPEPPAAPEPEPDAEAALLRIARLEGNFQWLGLLDGEAHVAELRVAGPELRIVVGSDGRVVPLVAARSDAQPAEPEPEAEQDEGGAGLPVLLDLLSIENASFLLVDLAHPERNPLELSFGALDLSALALRAGELEVGALGLREPRLRLRRDIDLSAFQAEEAAPAPEAVAEQPAEAAPALALKVTEIDVEAAELALLVDDEEMSATLHLQAQDVNLREPFPFELGIGLEGGSFEIAGRAGARPASFDGSVTWSALPLARLARAVGSLPVALESGESDGELQVQARLGTGAEGEAPGISVSGRVGVRALSGSLPAQDGLEVAFAWQDLGAVLDALELDPSGAAPARVEVASLTLDAPQFRVARGAAAAASPPAAEAGGAEAAQSEASGAAPASAEPAAAPPPRLRVASLELKDGALDFEDSVVSPPHRTRLRPIELSARDLRWPERQVASLVLRARDERDGSALALDLDAGEETGNASLSVERLGLPSWSPYLAEAAGYWVEDGQLTLDAKAQKQGRRVEIDGDLELRDLDLDEVKGGSFEEEFGVPLDLALALLRDPRGRISVPIPVTLDDTGSGANLAPIVTAVLRQAIVGALTSPLKGLGMGFDLVLGGGKGTQGMQLAPVAFAPGADAPAASELARLGGISDILAKRPGLSLVLHGRAGPADDPALAEQILIEAVRGEGELPPVSAGFFQKRRLRGALEKRAEGRDDELDAEDAEALRRWIAAVKVTGKRRDALAQRRAAALREELVKEVGLPAEDVAVGDPLDGEPAVLIQLVTSR